MKLSEYLNINYPLYTNHISKRETRHDFFKNIDTELHAYLLGLIMSDGSIDDKRATLSHTVNKKDKELLNYYRLICPKAYTQEFIPKPSKGIRNDKMIIGTKSIRLAIASVILIEDLHNLGIEQNKTYKEQNIPKQIPNKYIHHFIRGYFDGDGSFSGSVVKDKNKPNPRVRMQFQIDSKTKTILEDIKLFFDNNEIKTNIYECKRDNMYRLASHSITECKKIYHLLYDNSHCFLKRKFNKFNYYVNTEVSQIITDHRNAQEMNVNESNNSPTSAEHLNSNEKDENIC